MVGARKLGLLGATSWSRSTVEEFAAAAGRIKYCPAGTYLLGLRSASDAVVEKTNAALQSRSFRMSGMFFAEAVASNGLFTWMAEQIAPTAAGGENRHVSRDDAASCDPALARRPWEYALAFAYFGWRMPREEEWEALVFRSTTQESHRRAQEAAREFIAEKSNPRIGAEFFGHTEFTSSVGFYVDPHRCGAPLELERLSLDFSRWPGLIARGLNSQSSSPYSRRTASGSRETSSASLAAVCMEAASS